MLGQVIEIKGLAVSSRQGLLTNQSCGSWVKVDSVSESDNQVIERNVEAVAREVSVVGERVHHGARASSYDCQIRVILVAKIAYSRSDEVGACHSLPAALTAKAVEQRKTTLKSIVNILSMLLNNKEDKPKLEHCCDFYLSAPFIPVNNYFPNPLFR